MHVWGYECVVLLHMLHLTIVVLLYNLSRGQVAIWPCLPLSEFEGFRKPKSLLHLTEQECSSHSNQTALK